MEQNLKTACVYEEKRDAVLEARPHTRVTCPHCWTEQYALRDICYGCGARFVYLDEIQKTG